MLIIDKGMIFWHCVISGLTTCTYQTIFVFWRVVYIGCGSSGRDYTWQWLFVCYRSIWACWKWERIRRWCLSGGYPFLRYFTGTVTVLIMGLFASSTLSGEIHQFPEGAWLGFISVGNHYFDKEKFLIPVDKWNQNIPDKPYLLLFMLVAWIPKVLWNPMFMRMNLNLHYGIWCVLFGKYYSNYNQNNSSCCL